MTPQLSDIDPIDLFRPVFEQSERSEGRHVSRAIRSVMQAIEPDKYGDDGGPPAIRALLGNAMEEAVVSGLCAAYPDRFTRPGELQLDDIFGTPDLWDVEEWATIEIKLTWASSNRADEDIEDPWFWKYWTQLKSYCHMAGQTRGYLIIIFVNGNYRRDDPDGSQPQARMYQCDFTTDELQEVWDMVKERA